MSAALISIKASLVNLYAKGVDLETYWRSCCFNNSVLAVKSQLLAAGPCYHVLWMLESPHRSCLLGQSVYQVRAKDECL